MIDIIGIDGRFGSFLVMNSDSASGKCSFKSSIFNHRFFLLREDFERIHYHLFQNFRILDR